MNEDYEWYPKIGDTIQTSKDAKEWSEPFIWQGGDIQVLHNYWREPPSTFNPMTQSIEQQAENNNNNQMKTAGQIAEERYPDNNYEYTTPVQRAAFIEGYNASKWISANNKPKESGRYWCYVEEVNELGTSHYQWNCAYNQGEDKWTDNFKTMRVTHWMPLPSPPKNNL